MDEKFIGIVTGILNINPELLNENSTADTIPEWDSLSHWAVIGELEDVYGVEFTIDEATGFKNLADIYNTLMKKLSK